MQILIVILIMSLVFGSLWGVSKWTDGDIAKRRKEFNERYDEARKLFHVGQLITLKNDYYGEDLLFRKGSIGTVTELPERTYIAIVKFDELEICIDLFSLGKLI